MHARGNPRYPVIAIVIILNAVMLFALIKVARRQIALSSMYADKGVCAYASTKKTIVFLDDRSLQAIKKFHLGVSEIIAGANGIWKENRVGASLDTAKLQVRSWNTGDSNCKFYDAAFENEYACLTGEIGPRARDARRSSNPDVLIFITSNGISDMSGKAFWEKNEGNGTIVLNLGRLAEKYDADPKLQAVAKRFFKRRFAQLIIHEQAHLYGLPHSPGLFSIMKENVDVLGDRRTGFSADSRSTLIRVIAQLERQKNACAATP